MIVCLRQVERSFTAHRQRRTEDQLTGKRHDFYQIQWIAQVSRQASCSMACFTVSLCIKIHLLRLIEGHFEAHCDVEHPLEGHVVEVTFVSLVSICNKPVMNAINVRAESGPHSLNKSIRWCRRHFAASPPQRLAYASARLIPKQSSLMQVSCASLCHWLQLTL